MNKVICPDCGNEMEFQSILIPGIEEYEDYYECYYGHQLSLIEAEEQKS